VSWNAPRSQVPARPSAQLQQAGWKVDPLADGTFRWTIPAGRSYDTEPTRYPI
jgi:hypothetical protein